MATVGEIRKLLEGKDDSLDVKFVVELKNLDLEQKVKSFDADVAMKIVEAEEPKNEVVGETIEVKTE